MGSKILSYGETAIIKNAFQKKTTSININEIEINSMVLFNKNSYGNKGSLEHYTGYKLFTTKHKASSANWVC